MANLSEMIPTLTDLVELAPIQGTLDLISKIAGGLFGLYILYIVVTFIMERVKGKKIKKIYQNTESILERLGNIEKKLGVSGSKKEKVKAKENRK